MKAETLIGEEVAREVHPLRVRGRAEPSVRAVPAEAPVAIVCNGTTVAVMMATPADLEDFGIGFVLSERIVSHAGEIESTEIVRHEKGVEVRLWIAQGRMERLRARRRHAAGPTGCGLCGIESLEEAVRDLPAIASPGPVVAAEALRRAMACLRDEQRLNALTRGVHAAALWHPESGYLAVREDVGRHNALDKLIGALARREAGEGVLLLTSRVSIELVQKAAVAGLPVLVAVSVPTELAIRTAQSVGMTLVGVARDDGFEVFTHPGRIAGVCASEG